MRQETAIVMCIISRPPPKLALHHQHNILNVVAKQKRKKKQQELQCSTLGKRHPLRDRMIKGPNNERIARTFLSELVFCLKQIICFEHILNSNQCCCEIMFGGVLSLLVLTLNYILHGCKVIYSICI